MRVEIDFLINEDRKFRTFINEGITSFIYRAIRLGDEKYGNMLHEEGFKKNGSHEFKFHTYSVRQNNKPISDRVEKGIATLILSSALEDTVINFVKGLLQIGDVQIFSRSYNIESIRYIKEPKFKESNMFFINSPIYMEDSERKWLQPDEMEKGLGERLLENYYVLYGKLPKDTNIRIKFIKTSKFYTKYKFDTMRGILGTIVLEGSKELIKLAYEIGLGRSTGLGMGLISRYKV